MNFEQKEKFFAAKIRRLGQFMTPPEVANFIVEFIRRFLNKKINLAIDPACGEGIFLKSLLKKNIRTIVGVEIDPAIISEGLKNKCKILTPRNGLLPLDEEFEGKAEVVVGNPPFSAKYGRITDRELLSRFRLGSGRASQAVEILFLERFLQLAAPRGVIGIILPESIFVNLSLQYVRDFILQNGRIIAIISLPRKIFRGTSAKTIILFFQKLAKMDKNTKIFMGMVNNLKDFSLILKLYQQKENLPAVGCWVDINPHILLPEVYVRPPPAFITNPKMIKLKNLVSKISSGKILYGPDRKFAPAGLPYISAKVITPLGIDFTKEDRGRLYIDVNSKMYHPQAHVKKNDLLFVRVGVGCIGRSAVVTCPSEQGIADDWIYIVRFKNEALAYYVAFFLQSKYGKLQIDRLKRGVGTVNIPQTLFLEIVLPLPTEEQLQKFKEYYLEMIKWRQKDENKAKKRYTLAMKLIDKIMSKIS